MARTAVSMGIWTLYHWQRFDPDRLVPFLRTGKLYCSSPKQFNDPWDCELAFDIPSLEDPEVRRRHADWAVDLTTRRAPMSAMDTERMRLTLINDPARAAELLTEISAATSADIANRFRVYCLGSDPTNLLMWSHYAEDHSGIALEFSLRNGIMCAALECQYHEELPLFPIDGGGDEQHLTVLLAKSHVWKYEQEFRLVTQERAAANTQDTLFTDGGLLQLPQGALTAIVVGCKGDVAAVQRLVDEHAAGLPVKRAVRLAHRYKVAIEG
jgi:hypothetical protein